jgi:hypothetical protein
VWPMFAAVRSSLHFAVGRRVTSVEWSMAASGARAGKPHAIVLSSGVPGMRKLPSWEPRIGVGAL